MLHDRDLSSYLYEKSTSTTVYIQNRSLILMRKHLKRCSLVRNQTFHIFGYLDVYMHIPKEKRTKMEPYGKKGTFVGYSETSKEFRIYVPGERHVEVS